MTSPDWDRRPDPEAPTDATPPAGESGPAEPTSGEPAAAEPTRGELGSVGPTSGEPAVAEPTRGEPGPVGPTSGEPAVAEPTRGEPGPVGPTSGEPRAAEPAADEPGPGARRSGLRNPVAAVRGLGAAALGLEGIVLLLAIQPVRILGGGLSAAGVWTVVGLALVCFALCGIMRRAWAWHAGTLVQMALLLGGFLHWSLFALGVIFGLAWVYVLHVRRTILGA